MKRKYRRQEYTALSRTDIAEDLSDLEKRVTLENGTEPPFRNEYYESREEGIYVDLYSGEPLFSSLDKFDSHCGWPSFSRPVNSLAVQEKTDRSHGMLRTEVRSSRSDVHLGHVFEDGPEEMGGLRYCINSAAVRFIPREELEEMGYGEFLDLFRK